MDALLRRRRRLSEGVQRVLRKAAEASREGVARVHLLDRQRDGALLLELFTRDGAGLMITREPYERIRPAGIDDVGGILELIEPLERAGTLARRSRERLEQEIDRFVVIERDGGIIGCAALYPFEKEGMGELACLAVHPDYRGEGRAAQLLEYIERRARELDLGELFVLSTRTAHWFRERGFQPAGVERLPGRRRDLYNWQRRSKVFVKPLA